MKLKQRSLEFSLNLLKVVAWLYASIVLLSNLISPLLAGDIKPVLATKKKSLFQKQEQVKNKSTIQKLAVNEWTLSVEKFGDRFQVKKASHFGRIKDADIAMLDKLKRLRSLWVQGDDAVNQNLIDSISQKTTLQSLYLSEGRENRSIKDLSSLKSLTNLSDLTLSGLIHSTKKTTAEEFDVTFLVKFPKLKKLAIIDSYISDKTLRVIASCQHLEELMLVCEKGYLPKTAIHLLSKSSGKLKKLTIVGGLKNDDSIHLLSNCPSLKKLVLSGGTRHSLSGGAKTHFMDFTGNRFDKLNQLEVLGLYGCRIVKDDIQILAKIPNLRELSVSGWLSRNPDKPAFSKLEISTDNDFRNLKVLRVESEIFPLSIVLKKKKLTEFSYLGTLSSLDGIQNQTKLKRLWIRARKFTPFRYKNLSAKELLRNHSIFARKLSSCKSLRELKLVSVHLDWDAFFSIMNINKNLNLYVRRSVIHLGKNAQRVLSNQVYSLHLDSVVGLDVSNYRTIFKNSNLSECEIYDLPENISKSKLLQNIALSPSIKKLRVNFDVSENDLRFILKMKNLESLSIRTKSISRAILSSMEETPSLSQVRFEKVSHLLLPNLSGLANSNIREVYFIQGSSKVKKRLDINSIRYGEIWPRDESTPNPWRSLW